MKLETKNPSKFGALDDQLQGYVNRGEVGHLLCAVFKEGQMVYSTKYGTRDLKKTIPVQFNDIYRIYSMTKPITSAALMILYDEGKFEIDDPISHYLPEFEHMQVLHSLDPESGNAELVDADLPITFRHLLTHTSGLSYGFFPQVPIDILYGKKFDFVGEFRAKSVLESIHRIDQLPTFSKQLASLPLMFQPGTKYWYSFGLDIIGYLVQKLSGVRFDLFLQKQLFDPLEMVDTGFYVPQEKWHRVSFVHTKTLEGASTEVTGPISSGYQIEPAILSGGGGLVSTLPDYLNFGQLLLNQGTFKGMDLISQDAVKLMSSNHLPEGKSFLDMQVYPIEIEKFQKLYGEMGYGLGVSVKIKDIITREPVGSYGWSGALNTLLRIDPTNEVLTVLLTQNLPVDNLYVQPILGSDIDPVLYDGLE